MYTVWKLTIAQLLMYARDRQSVFFAFFFPLFFMLALGFMVGQDEIDPIEVSVVTSSESEAVAELVGELQSQELLSVHEEDEATARQALQAGERRLVIMVPDQYTGEQDESVSLAVLVDADQPQESQQAIAILQGTLVDIERQLRGEEPLFTLEIEDVEAREMRYVDFLIPGLLALMIMQLSIAGSGFNIVEYKRKGILKRLFVTPLRPLEFILSLIVSRLVIVMVQITLLLVVAKLVFGISIIGSLVLLYLFAVLGCILFLGLGFALGGIANTQNSVMTIGNLFIFPQMFLAGVFFSLEALPVWLQPVAKILPLSFVSDAIRQVANEGAQLADLGLDIVGILVWLVIGIFLAVYFFRWGEDAAA